MSTEDFITHHKVIQSISELDKYLKNNPKKFSDLEDDDGNQYVDFVCEGGGVLGIALAGYTYALEEAGLRFRHIGGTSAGAINTLLMAAIGNKDEKKSLAIIEEIANKNFSDFIDGDSDAQDFIRTVLDDKNGFAKIAWKAWQVIDNIMDNLGLNPGKNFHKWITNVLLRNNIKKLLDLQKKLNYIPKGMKASAKSKLRIVATDITTQTKTIFPEMASLYWKDVDNVSPANFVRASMSIPGFFHPYKVKNLPRDKNAVKKWQSTVGYYGPVPKVAYFVDGGMMSNFPISLFHNTKVLPKAPTFGVKLSPLRDHVQNVKKPLNFLAAMVNASRHNADFDFLRQNPDYKQLVCSIKTKDHNWLNFDMKENEQIELFSKGVEAAVSFLKEFDWEAYKQTRKDLMNI